MRIRGAALACLAALLAGTPPAAAGELRAGVVRQDHADWWAVSEGFERAWALNLEYAFAPLARRGGVDIVPFVGGTLAQGDELDKVYAGLNLELRGDLLFIRLGLGGALHNGKTNDPSTYATRQQMGSSLLFHVPVEAGVQLTPALSLSAYYDHNSNAGLADVNEGLDSLGLRLGWRF